MKNMNSNINIIDVTPENISRFAPTCFLNPENEGYQTKLKWLRKRFSEGLMIKLLYFEKEKKYQGFIEYVLGEYTWRAIDAKGYMFIQRAL